MGTVMPSFAMLLLIMLGGGGNDLLDYVQTDAYWKAKDVTVSVDQLLGELVPPKGEDISKLIHQLGAEDPAEREAATQKIMQAGPVVIPQLQAAINGANAEIATRAGNLVEGLTAAGKAAEVRRLMAIRTLGELKKPEGVTGLKALLGAKEAFVAEYAANAIAAIEGKPAHRPEIADNIRRDDLNLLPAKLDGVAQYHFGNGAAVTIEQLLSGLDLPPPGQRNEAYGQITGAVLQVAEKIGNVRLDLVTAGAFTNAPNAPGYGVIVVHGKWDAAAISTLTAEAAAMGAKSEVIDGFRVFTEGKRVALIIRSDDRAVLIFGDENADLPTEAMIAALKKGSGDFATNAELAKLLDGVDRTAVLWVAANVTDGLRQVAPYLQPFSSGTISLSRAGDVLTATWKATGKNPDEVKAAADDAMKNVQTGIKELSDLAKMMPPMQPAVDFLKSIHMETDGITMNGGATFKGVSKMLPIMMMGWHAEAHVEPAPNNPAPAQVKPAPAQPVPQPDPVPAK